MTESQKSTNVRSVLWQLRALQLGLKTLGAISPRIAGRVGLERFLTPRSFARPEREKGWIAAAQRRFIDFDGQRLAIWSWGEGPPVLLVHGWEGRGSQLGAIAMRLASAGFGVHAIDAPGHGDSDGARSSLPQFGEAVARAASELGPLEGIVAHSFGAAGTAWAARDAPVARRMAFVSPPGDLDHSVRGFCTLMGLSPASQVHFFANLERRFDIDWNEARRIVLATARETPILVVSDEQDDETPLAGARDVADAWPNSELVATSGLGHRRILRDEAVVERIARFMSGARPAVQAPYTEAEACCGK